MFFDINEIRKKYGYSILFETNWGFSWICKSILFWSQGHVRKSRNHRNEVFGFSHEQINAATGPLTQATGPPWSGGGVAIGMLRGNPVLSAKVPSFSVSAI